MKALVKSKDEQGLWLQDVPQPTIQKNEVLIKVQRASICGTDISIYKWTEWAQKNVSLGTTIGHEFMGEIVEVGSDVHDLHVGQRVSAESHVVCGQCFLCKTDRKHLCPKTKVIGIHQNGCFAEYLAIPAENVFVLPDFVKSEIASIFDPFGNAVHTAFSTPLEDQDVLITGAGPIGVMAVAIAKQAGARSITITDINDYRLSLAKKMGATAAINIQNTPLVKPPHGFTVGMEMSGVPSALNDLLKTSCNGAHISLLGILPPNTPINWDLVIFKMLTLKGIFGREIFKTWHQMIELLENGLDISPIITHTYKFDDYQKGFDAMLSGNSGKVVLEL